MLEEGVSDHRHERVTMKALPGPSLEVVEAEFLFQLSGAFCLVAASRKALDSSAIHEKRTMLFQTSNFLRPVGPIPVAPRGNIHTREFVVQI